MLETEKDRKIHKKIKDFTELNSIKASHAHSGTKTIYNILNGEFSECIHLIVDWIH